MAQPGKFLTFYKITLEFISGVLQNNLALAGIFVLGTAAVIGVERMEVLWNILVDGLAKLIP